MLRSWAWALVLGVFACGTRTSDAGDAAGAANAADKPASASSGGLPGLEDSGTPLEIAPLLKEYCYRCHGNGKKKGGLALDSFPDLSSMIKNSAAWEKVVHHLRTREMPPEDKPQPSGEERQRMVTWIEREVFGVDCDHPDPGRVTIRRLNRVEYNNTIRDLVGVQFNPADDFPADDSGYGFDNIGDVLSMPPVLMEKYLAAAEKILALALGKGAAEKKSDPAPETYRRIFVMEPGPENTNACARAVVSHFAARAFRRPIEARELERLLGLFEKVQQDGGTFEESVQVALEAVLVSPHFLFRGELQPEPNNPGAVYPIGEYDLASRLSYFLWSSMPDEQLFAEAEHGTLRKNLEREVQRMLDDPKSEALVANFAGQWLQIRNLSLVTPDRKLFGDFDESLRAAMEKETELYFARILRENRSVLEFIDSDYTFVNERLARHYGIEGVSGPEFRLVLLKGTQRGGVITQGSVLTVTSNPTRTSPVKRGKWVLENLLGAPPPPPPPDVPELNESKEVVLSGTLRQRMEQHREKPLCASCHARMDPIGFGLENFDGIGAWRTKDGPFPVEPSGKLASGETFQGPAELKRILLKEKKDDFARCLAEKLLTYALGRGIEPYDRCAIEAIAQQLESDGYRCGSLVMGIINSTPFQKRRGDGGRAGSTGVR